MFANPRGMLYTQHTCYVGAKLHGVLHTAQVGKPGNAWKLPGDWGDRGQLYIGLSGCRLR